MTDDEDGDGPLLFSDDELEWDDEPEPPNTEAVLVCGDGTFVGVTREQYVRLCWWVEHYGNVKA